MTTGLTMMQQLSSMKPVEQQLLQSFVRHYLDRGAEPHDALRHAVRAVHGEAPKLDETIRELPSGLAATAAEAAEGEAMMERLASIQAAAVDRSAMMERFDAIRAAHVAEQESDLHAAAGLDMPREELADIRLSSKGTGLLDALYRWQDGGTTPLMTARMEVGSRTHAVQLRGHSEGSLVITLTDVDVEPLDTSGAFKQTDAERPIQALSGKQLVDLAHEEVRRAVESALGPLVKEWDLNFQPEAVQAVFRRVLDALPPRTPTLWCCEPGCGKPASYWVGKDDRDDCTHACADHVDGLRGVGDVVQELPPERCEADLVPCNDWPYCQCDASWLEGPPPDDTEDPFWVRLNRERGIASLFGDSGPVLVYWDRRKYGRQLVFYGTDEHVDVPILHHWSEPVTPPAPPANPKESNR